MDTFVNQVTLEYLMNKNGKQFAKNQKKYQVNKNDQKFYRKRILGMTKDLLYDPSLCPLYDIQHTFNIYVKTCIDYFKMLDKTDIIQEDYLEMMNCVKELDTEENTELEYNKEDANKLLMRSIQINKPNLDKFVRRVPTSSPANPSVLPKQKNINLKDPNLKNKGLVNKKKNSNIIYDEKENEETSDSKNKNTENEVIALQSKTE